jgi:hypothetical protein
MTADAQVPSPELGIRRCFYVADLEKQFERKLQFTRVVDLRGDDSCCAVSKRGIGRPKLRVVKKVECLSAELQGYSFKERCVFNCGKIHVH